MELGDEFDVLDRQRQGKSPRLLLGRKIDGFKVALDDSAGG
jgi:hypothetical protein